MTQTSDLLSIPALLQRACSDRFDRAAIHFQRCGRTESRTWSEMSREAAKIAIVLKRLGVDRGFRVAQISDNRYEWVLGDLAIQLARAVHVPIHASLAGEQIAYQLKHCGATVAIVAGHEVADKLTPLSQEFNSGLHFLSWDDWPDSAAHPLAPCSVAALATAVSDGDAEFAIGRTGEGTDPRELATIMYTSGTTGTPRGVMLTHENLVSNAIATSNTFDILPDELRLCFLPLTHIYARTCDMYTWLYRASELALAESRETILADCARYRPTLLNGVPYFYDKLYRRLNEAGQAVPPGTLRSLLGGRIRHCFSGGAALPDHVAHFFASQGVPLLQGYGLSESSPVITASREDGVKIGTVGQPIAGVEVRIAPDGEILTRGPHVMAGYWRDEAATREAIRDGWLHTGDLGQLDDEGYLKITGRKKEILVTATGKNIVPTHIEGLLAASPLVAQVMVVGEGRNYLTALVVPDPDRLRSEIAARSIQVSSRADALVHPDVLALYRHDFDRLLSGQAHCEQIGRFTLLDRPFTLEAGELTAKASLRRSAIAAHFAAEIAAMYDSPETPPINPT